MFSPAGHTKLRFTILEYIALLYEFVILFRFFFYSSYFVSIFLNIQCTYASTKYMLNHSDTLHFYVFIFNYYFILSIFFYYLIVGFFFSLSVFY